MLAAARTFALLGVEAREVQVEVHVGPGLPAFSLVGLPDAAVRESRERVRAALVNSGFKFPQQRITANLAPADLRKAGPGFDLAIAAALLAASDQLTGGGSSASRWPASSLWTDRSGRFRGRSRWRRRRAAGGSEAIAVPGANAPEAMLADGRPRDPARAPRAAASRWAARASRVLPPSRARSRAGARPTGPDLADLRGQPYLRYALEVAAAGGHSVLIVGPPGAGKSLAARRLPSILPPLEPRRGAGGAADRQRLRARWPAARLARDAPVPRPAPHDLDRGPGRRGLAAAAGRGDAGPPRACCSSTSSAEFSREALEALRQPLEEGRVAIVRARHAVELPCRFMLVAASNPCPCGRGEESGECECRPGVGAPLSRQAERGARRPDRHLRCRSSGPAPQQMAAGAAVDSASVRERVVAARERQERRLGPGRCNAEMTLAELRASAVDSTPRPSALLAEGHATLRLSGRGHDRVLRVSRTIADLDGLRAGLRRARRPGAHPAAAGPG